MQLLTFLTLSIVLSFILKQGMDNVQKVNKCASYIYFQRNVCSTILFSKEYSPLPSTVTSLYHARGSMRQQINVSMCAIWFNCLAVMVLSKLVGQALNDPSQEQLITVLITLCFL